MTPFDPGLYLPRVTGSAWWRPLLDLHGQSLDQLRKNRIDLRRAEFHPAGEQRISEPQLLAWRESLNDWASDRSFPAAMNLGKSSAWDVELGLRLLKDLGHLPEILHPDVWCWLATNLLPHFVAYRWGWPEPKDGETPVGGDAWARFGPGPKNGLRLAVQRILTYGPDIASRASEQEFQSLQNRPAYGLDKRVARLVLQTLVDAFDDPASNYGKNGGTRTLDANDVCIELRLINSLQPFCFAVEDNIVSTVEEIIERLPNIRRPLTPTGLASSDNR